MPTNAEAQSVTMTRPAPSASSRSRSADARAVVSIVAISEQNAAGRPFVRNACGAPRIPTSKSGALGLFGPDLREVDDRRDGGAHVGDAGPFVAGVEVLAAVEEVRRREPARR